MNIYDVNGNAILVQDFKLVGAVLDANSETDRFLAMKQLFDIAVRKMRDPTYSPSASDFSYATKGAVCVLPTNPSMYERYTYDLLYSKNRNVQSIPASTTKVMALLTAMPFLSNMEDYVTLVSGDIESGSGNYFSAGDVLTIEDLFYGMMLPSSNTCAKALAHHCGKIILNDNTATVSSCVSAFVTEMNRRADVIGCANSVFTTPSGYDINNKSTADDLLRITIAAASYAEINRVWNKKSYDISVGGTNPRTVHLDTTVSNATLESDYYIFGGKTGHITGQADALVMIAEKN